MAAKSGQAPIQIAAIKAVPVRYALSLRSYQFSLCAVSANKQQLAEYAVELSQEHNISVCKETRMSLVAVTGKVSHLNRVSSVTGGGGGTDVETSHQTTLRVNGRHVKVEGPMSWVADDDHIAIVGVEEEGVLEPLAVRNDTSGYESYASTKSYTLAIVCIFLGVFTFFITTAFGAWLIWGIKKQKKLNAEAKRMLHDLPRG